MPSYKSILNLSLLALLTALALSASQDRILTSIDPNATTGSRLAGHVHVHGESRLTTKVLPTLPWLSPI